MSADASMNWKPHVFFLWISNLLYVSSWHDGASWIEFVFIVSLELPGPWRKNQFQLQTQAWQRLRTPSLRGENFHSEFQAELLSSLLPGYLQALSPHPLRVWFYPGSFFPSLFLCKQAHVSKCTLRHAHAHKSTRAHWSTCTHKNTHVIALPHNYSAGFECLPQTSRLEVQSLFLYIWKCIFKTHVFSLLLNKPDGVYGKRPSSYHYSP